MAEPFYMEASGTAPPVDPLRRQMMLLDKAYRELPVEDAQRATVAALKYQGTRGYLRDISSGKSPEEAMAKWGPLLFIDKPATAAATARMGPKIMNIGGVGYRMNPKTQMLESVTPPRPAAKAEEVTVGGVPWIRTTQPSGTISLQRNVPPTDEMAQELRRSLIRARTGYENAERDQNALMSATRPEVTPAILPSPARRLASTLFPSMVSAQTVPAVTNQVPVATEDQVAIARAKAEEYRRVMETKQRELENYISQRQPAPSNAQPQPSSAPSPAPAPAAAKRLTRDQARRYLNLAEGDADAARDLARADGFTF